MAGIVERLTEGMVSRDLQKEGVALQRKWERTGLLEGLDGYLKNSMSLLLENQAKELLRESSTMASGDVEGFAAVAFPIVRRVFGQLIANEIVSVQPMSLPSGLVFFLDFTFGNQRPSGSGSPWYDPKNGVVKDSLYGGGVVGSQITGGVNLSGVNAEKGFYNMNTGYSSPMNGGTATVTTIASGTVNYGVDANVDQMFAYDPDLSGSNYAAATVPLSSFAQLNRDSFITLTITSSLAYGKQVRRVTKMYSPTSVFVALASATATATQLAGVLSGTMGFQWAATDDFTNGGSLGSVMGAPEWLLESNGSTAEGHFGDVATAAIPEIDIKVDSIAITAITKKLRAKWSPELGQDLNAYHNLDAEVELTSILSEEIALEIDREILGDLIKGQTAGVKYWSRRPGKFVNRDTGVAVVGQFTGNVSMWYETLIETINDISAVIHRKTLRGGANFIVCAPEVANLLEFTAGFRASVVADETKGGSAGAQKVGSISKKWDIYVDPYFARNLLLVGRKGSSFLESGYVYAPYVPLQVTPTIFGTEDFVPRKGVLTRYGKKMTRPDYFGIVVVEDLLG